MSVCAECFHLKLTNGGRRARCSENVFKEKLDVDHPFFTVMRDCPRCDDDPDNEQENIDEHRD
jgi:hypothetical protein